MRKKYDEKVRLEALRLHEEELGLTRIKQRLQYTMGVAISVSTIRRWIDPVYAERHRVATRDAKRRRKGVCVDCGGPTAYNGKAAPYCTSERCNKCSRVRARAGFYRQRKWTNERIIEAIHDWASLYGEPPASLDWNPGNARDSNNELRARRFEAYNGRFPGTMTVVRNFGSWNKAIKAAGYTPRQVGGGGANSMRRRNVIPIA